jgi:cyclopropane-fatty-acyl-phospholipid synthase
MHTPAGRAWSDALEANLDAALKALERPQDARRAGRIPRACSLCLAGSAMGFERGWIALHQMLSTRPSPACAGARPPGAQSGYPFNRSDMYT